MAGRASVADVVPPWDAAPATLPLEELFEAVRDGDVEKAALAMDRGADVNAAEWVHWGGQRCVHVAILHFHEPLFRLLLDRGADVNGTDSQGRTILHLLARRGSETARLEWTLRERTLALADGAAADATVPFDGDVGEPSVSASGASAACAFPTLARLDLECKTQGSGLTPLAVAVMAGHLANVLLLLQAGADACTTSAHGESLVHFAARTGHTGVARALLRFGAPADSGAALLSPSTIAAVGGHGPLVRLLARESHRSIHDPDPVVGATLVDTLRRGGFATLADSMLREDRGRREAADAVLHDEERRAAEAAARAAEEEALRRKKAAIEARQARARAQEDADRAFLVAARKRRVEEAQRVKAQAEALARLRAKGMRDSRATSTHSSRPGGSGGGERGGERGESGEGRSEEGGSRRGSGAL